MKKCDGHFGMRTYLKTMTSLGRNVIAEFYKKQLEKQLKKEKEKRISWNDGNKKLIEGQWYVKGTDFWKND